MTINSDIELSAEPCDVVFPVSRPERKLIYLIRRIVFLVLYVINIGTFGLLNYAIAPISSKVFFNDIRFWRHLHKFHKLNYRVFTHTKELFTNRDYSKAFKISWLDAPRNSPDLTKVMIKDEWRVEHGESCDGCVHCCERIQCNLIDYERRGCMLYGSFFWRYFTCGPFPNNQLQIDYYQCKKWKEC